MTNNDDAYDVLLKDQDKRHLSAGTACILLEAFLGFRLKIEREQCLQYVESIVRLLDRVEDRAHILGWLEDESQTDIEIAE